MTDTERVTRLREILKPIIDWTISVENDPDMEDMDIDSYLYDMTYEEFNSLSRGDFQQIIELLK